MNRSSPRRGSDSAVTASTRASGGASVAERRPRSASSAAGVALGLDHDAVAVVQDEAAEPVPAREAVDERAEADALDDAATGTAALTPASRSWCGESAGRIGVHTDVG